MLFPCGFMHCEIKACILPKLEVKASESEGLVVRNTGTIRKNYNGAG
jgi:hypothetical protein